MREITTQSRQTHPNQEDPHNVKDNAYVLRTGVSFVPRKQLGNYADQPKQNTSGALTGTLQKMIVENGSVTLNLDLNGLNGSNDLTTRPVTLQFAAGTNSFFPILVFNDELRGPEPGSIALVPQGRPVSLLPAVLAASLKQLVVEKLPSDAAFDLAVRDGKTGLTFSTSKETNTITILMQQLLSIQVDSLLDFKGVCQRSGPAVGRWCECWKNLHRRYDATDRDQAVGQRPNQIGDHAAAARCGQRRDAGAASRTGCHCRRSCLT